MSRIGDSNVVFGTTDEPWGYIENLRHTKEVTHVTQENGAGVTVAGELVNPIQNVSGEYTFRNVSDDPWDEVGTTDGILITDIGVTIYITSAQKVWSKGEYMKISFEGVYYPSLAS